MQRWLLAVLVMVALVLPGFSVAADDIPDLKGTWTGTSSSIKYGKDDPKGHLSEEDLAKVSHTDFTMVIDFQEGRNFSGTRSSSMNKERVVGVVRPDNKSIFITDEDSFFIGELLAPDKLELVWMEVHPSTHGAGYTVYTRKK